MRKVFTVKQMSQLTQLDDGTWGYDFLVLLDKELDNSLLSLKEEYSKKGLNEENMIALEKAANDMFVRWLSEEPKEEPKEVKKAKKRKRK